MSRCGQQVNINVFQLGIDGCKVDSMMIRKQEPSWQYSRIRSFVRHPQFWNGSSNWSPNMSKTFFKKNILSLTQVFSCSCRYDTLLLQTLTLRWPPSAAPSRCQIMSGHSTSSSSAECQTQSSCPIWQTTAGRSCSWGWEEST